MIWFMHWVDLVDAIIGIVTLNFYCPHWGFKIRTWWAKKRIKDLKKAFKK